MKCAAFCLAKSFRFTALKEALAEHEKVAIYRDVLHLMKFGGDIFIFPYGAAVTWGISHDDTLWLLDILGPFLEEAHPEPYRDEFSYTTVTEQFRVHNDHIDIAQEGALPMMAFSHAIAQSVKLSELEDRVGQTISSTARFPINIAMTGKTQLGRREISRLRGRLYLVETDINLKFELLDTPEFFWEFPELEYLFDMMAKYLDIKSRTESLNKKLGVIHDLLLMLAEEQNHKHLANLEWIIIWLIGIEILYFIFQEILKRL